MDPIAARIEFIFGLIVVQKPIVILLYICMLTVFLLIVCSIIVTYQNPSKISRKFLFVSQSQCNGIIGTDGDGREDHQAIWLVLYLAMCNMTS